MQNEELKLIFRVAFIAKHTPKDIPVVKFLVRVVTIEAK